MNVTNYLYTYHNFYFALCSCVLALDIYAVKLNIFTSLTLDHFQVYCVRENFRAGIYVSIYKEKTRRKNVELTRMNQNEESQIKNIKNTNEN